MTNERRVLTLLTNEMTPAIIESYSLRGAGEFDRELSSLSWTPLAPASPPSKSAVTLFGIIMNADTLNNTDQS